MPVQWPLINMKQLRPGSFQPCYHHSEIVVIMIRGHCEKVILAARALVKILSLPKVHNFPHKSHPKKYSMMMLCLSSLAPPQHTHRAWACTVV